MAKIATIIDDFQDGTINPSLWTADPGITETGGRAKIVPSTSHPILGSVLPRSHDLTSSEVVGYIPTVTSNGSTGTLQSVMAVDKDANNLISIRKVSSQLICTKVVAGTETNLAFTPYSAVNHLFWRIRADASNIYWETSSTGTSYFIQHTENIATLGFAITTVGLFFSSGYSGVEAFPGTFQIEAVNPGLPITASGASTSTGSLAFSVTGPVQITFSGASSSTGSLSMMTVSPLDLTASGASTSTGSLIFTNVPAGTVNITASGASTSAGSLSFLAVDPPPKQLTASAASTSSGYLALTMSLPGGVYMFEPPIAYDLPPTLPEPTRPRWINAHAKWKGGQRRGRSVLKYAGTGLYPLATLFPGETLFPVNVTNTTYVIVDTPTVDQMAAASFTYQGGHVYEITPEEAALLQNAGFTVSQ